MIVENVLSRSMKKIVMRIRKQSMSDEIDIKSVGRAKNLFNQNCSLLGAGVMLYRYHQT